MDVSAIAPEAVALSSNINPAKAEAGQSLAEKAREREDTPAVARSDAGEDRGRRLDIDA